MNSKLTLLLAFTVLATIGNAQDKIYTRKKGMVEAQIMEVTRGRILYRKAEDPAGRDYALDWDDVYKVEYEDGKIDYRKPLPVPHIAPVRYEGRNIASLAMLNISDEGFGLGLAYERMLDEDNYISLYAPMNFCLMAPYKYSHGESGTIGYSKSVFHAAPGIRFYPTHNAGRARYAVGVQLSYEGGTTTIENRFNSANGTQYFTEGVFNVQKLGFLLNNSINFFPNPKTYVAFDFGIGTTYYYRLNNMPQNARLLVQFNFRVGRRF